MNGSQNWYIVYTRKGHEKKAEKILRRKGFETFIPTCTRCVEKGSSVEVIEECLFPSWVFVYSIECQFLVAMDASNFLSPLYWLNKPATISKDEIDLIKYFTKKYKQITIKKANIRPAASLQNIVGDQASFMLFSIGYLISAVEGAPVNAPGNTLVKIHDERYVFATRRKKFSLHLKEVFHFLSYHLLHFYNEKIQ